MAAPEDRSLIELELAYISQEARAFAAAAKLRQARLEQAWLLSAYSARARISREAAALTLARLVAEEGGQL